MSGSDNAVGAKSAKKGEKQTVRTDQDRSRDLFTAPYDVKRALSFDSEHKLRSENLPFDIDVWYPKLEQFTFDTVFIPLSRAEARAIALAYRYNYIDRRSDSPLSATYRQTLRSLEVRIEERIKRHGFDQAGCFMRLCGRSAKDAEPRDRQRIRDEYQQHLDRLRSQQDVPTKELTSELKMRAVGQVSLLKAQSAADVMALLLSSERVYSDMLDWLWFGEPEQIVLRRWEPELSVDYEFRCYVHNGKLNAISQYDHYCRYDHLFPLKQELEAKMRALWEKVHQHVGTSDFGSG